MDRGFVESSLRDGDQPGLRLIETVGWTGSTVPRLPLHLARLHDAARRLGWPPCQGAAQALLAACPKTPARLRLTLDRAGAVEVTSTPLPVTKAIWRIGLAQQRLSSADPWLTVKSTHRAAYDTARATLPADLDEAILLNERDEVCDGAITTLFFDRGQGLRTPPLSCGLLPGVLRAELTGSGQAREEVLHAPDLACVRLWVGNSLRGLIPAVWSPTAGPG